MPVFTLLASREVKVSLDGTSITATTNYFLFGQEVKGIY
jgi:hypothetical protein